MSKDTFWRNFWIGAPLSRVPVPRGTRIDPSLNCTVVGRDLHKEVQDLSSDNQRLANEVVDLHARLRAYEDTAGELTRAHKLEHLLEDAIDTLQWLAAGQEVVYAHDVDVVARGLRDGLEGLGDA